MRTTHRQNTVLYIKLYSRRAFSFFPNFFFIFWSLYTSSKLFFRPKMVDIGPINITITNLYLSEMFIYEMHLQITSYNMCIASTRKLNVNWFCFHRAYRDFQNPERLGKLDTLAPSWSCLCKCRSVRVGLNIGQSHFGCCN